MIGFRLSSGRTTTTKSNQAWVSSMKMFVLHAFYIQLPVFSLYAMFGKINGEYLCTANVIVYLRGLLPSLDNLK